MVIYLDNQYIAGLEEALRTQLLNPDKPAEQDAAVRAALSMIAHEKERAPYQVWLKVHSTQETTS
jgi:hypothetical protein